MSEIPDAWVDDFFALAGEGMKPRCTWCGGEKEWNDDVKAWECINPDCEGG
jgi:hypothetical protein